MSNEAVFPLLSPFPRLLPLFVPHLSPLFCSSHPSPRNRLCLSGIGTADGSAKKDEDFKGKSQRQVQFNPGQTRATWRVRILTDGTYERAETFQILLSEPVMGVMEFPTSATVEILDPNDGQQIEQSRTCFVWEST